MSYFDLQVNGYGGVDFNQDGLTADDLHRACQKLHDDGVAGILATIITDHLPTMCGRLSRLVELRRGDELAQRIIRGLHIEGPFINPRDGYRGAHPADAVKPANLDDAKRLIDACDGLARLVTLAPDCDADMAVTRHLAKQGVVVSAGHCDPTLDQLRAALDAGLTMFTHVGNGCPMLMHRHDNIIQRVLSLADRLWLCFIADGVHVPFFTLHNYLRSAGLQRCIVVTDAIAPAGLGPGRYTLGRWQLVIGDDLAARAPDGSHLVGSAMSMPRAVANLRQHLGLSDEQIDQLTRGNPLRAMGGEIVA
ncbi:MAG: hypothetical protein WD042_19465 [Phycisphaeraceae bacterium]